VYEDAWRLLLPGRFDGQLAHGTVYGLLVFRGRSLLRIGNMLPLALLLGAELYILLLRRHMHMV
jgi:hypothetical protein